MSQITRGSNRQ